MKAYNILENACALIGTELDEGIKKAGVGLTNTILEDLKIPTVCSLSEEITAEKEYFTLISNGVAMLLSVYLGDDANLSVMSELYNNSRRRLLKRVDNVKETVFRGDIN